MSSIDSNVDGFLRRNSGAQYELESVTITGFEEQGQQGQSLGLTINDAKSIGNLIIDGTCTNFSIFGNCDISKITFEKVPTSIQLFSLTVFQDIELIFYCEEQELDLQQPTTQNGAQVKITFMGQPS